MEAIESVVGVREFSDNMASAVLNLQGSLGPIRDLVVGWNKGLRDGGFDPEMAQHAAMTLHNNLIQMLFVSAVNGAVAKTNQEVKRGKLWFRRTRPADSG